MILLSRPNEMANRYAVSSPFALRLFALLTAYELLSQQQQQSSFCSGAEVRLVRHKRTVSDFVENLMNAMYFHIQGDDEDDDDPLPLPSTVITRFTHVPNVGKVYKYVPVQTLKVSKMRARKIAEPKIKIKYPKKFSIKTEDSSITVLKNNDLPWTLHPLPPPLSTAKTIKLEVDKAMPWALHPLPPPVKTKNYSDYFWPDSRARPKYVLASKPHTKPYKITKAYRYNKPAAVDFKPSDFKPSDFKPSDFKPSDFKLPGYGAADHESGFEHDGPKIYKQTDDVKHVNFKQIDYQHVDYKSPAYVKPEFPSQSASEEDDADSHRPEDSGHRPVYDHRDHSYSQQHDDHSAPPPDHYAPSPSSHPRPSSEYVSHITIEPSIQIASYSDTEMRGDGTGNRQTVSGPRDKTACRCPVTGHRHKRHAAAAAADDDDRPTDGTAAAAGGDSAGGDSAASMTRDKYHVGRPGAGHATDVEIQKSRDITDNLMPMIMAVNRAGGPSKKTDTTFRDDSDMFKVDFGRAINAWDESKSTTAANKGPRTRPAAAAHDDDYAGSGEFGPRPARKPAKEPAGYHVTKSTVENKGGGVSFSVQTPFSVSSFSSKYRHPYVDAAPDDGDDGYPSSRFNEPGTTSSRFNDPGTTPLLSSSSFRSSPDEYLEPLDFEQFGFKSALRTDKPSGRLQTDHFSRGFGDTPSSVSPGGFPDGFGRGDKTSADFSSGGHWLTRPFSRGFGDDDDDYGRSHRTSQNRGRLSDRFNAGDSTKVGPASGGSVLEYFQPVVVDFGRSKDDRSRAKPQHFGKDDDDRTRYFGKTESAVFSKILKNRNPDPLRLPGGLHESTENLSRKMVFHPSTFDTEK